MLKSLSQAAIAALLVVASTALPLSNAAGADGRAMCAQRKELLASFSESFAEQPTAIGLASTGGVLELLTSETGSWTVFITLPTGVSCLIATGESWTVKARQTHATAS